jgi:hypothetical protein
MGIAFSSPSIFSNPDFFLAEFGFGDAFPSGVTGLPSNRSVSSVSAKTGDGPAAGDFEGSVTSKGVTGLSHNGSVSSESDTTGDGSSRQAPSKKGVFLVSSGGVIGLSISGSSSSDNRYSTDGNKSKTEQSNGFGRLALVESLKDNIKDFEF